MTEHSDLVICHALSGNEKEHLLNVRIIQLSVLLAYQLDRQDVLFILTFYNTFDLHYIVWCSLKLFWQQSDHWSARTIYNTLLLTWIGLRFFIIAKYTSTQTWLYKACYNLITLYCVCWYTIVLHFGKASNLFIFSPLLALPPSVLSGNTEKYKLLGCLKLCM